MSDSRVTIEGTDEDGWLMPRSAERIVGAPATVVLWTVALVIAGVSITTLLAPSTDRSSVASGIPPERLWARVGAIATEPHPMGSDEIARVRDHIVAELVVIGVEPEFQTVTAPDWFGLPGGTVEVTNVMARIAGVGDGTAILMMAHYDTVPTTPGANDNTTAVSALIEAGRVLATSPPLRNDVILLFTDGEEPSPRFGASAFSEHPWFADVGVAVNFEAIGDAGPSMLVEASGDVGELVEGLATADSPVAFSFLTKTADLIGGAATDFDVVRGAGMSGLSFAYLRGSSIYHGPTDDLRRVNEAGMAHHAAIAVDLARYFGGRDLSVLAPAGGTVFFTIPGRVLVRHPASLVPGLAIAAVALLIVGLVRTLAWAPFPWRQVVRGTGIALAGAVVAVVAGTALWLVIVALRPTMGVIESYAYLAVLLVLACAAWGLAWRRAQATSAQLAGGIIVVWATLAVAVGLPLPGIGYLFAWPALAATVALAMRSFAPGTPGWRLAALVLVAVPAAFVVTPAIDTFFLLATPRPGNLDSELPEAIVVSMLLAYLTFGLITGVAARRTVPLGDT
jgi:hypothetical protein